MTADRRWSAWPASQRRTPGPAASLLNAGRQAGGSIGLAVLGTVAWTVVSDSVLVAAAIAAREADCLA